MIIVLSPAKTLAEGPEVNQGLELPKYRKQSAQLIEILKGYKTSEIKELMKISDKLAALNYGRYQNFGSRYTQENSKAAIFMFKGDVYQGFGADTLDAKALTYAQKHLRIISGLYGLLRPMDKMQPYRLEMGTRLDNPKGPNLYEFWRDTITADINTALSEMKSDLLVNLASNEYFDAVDKKQLDAKILDITFKEYRDGKLKFVSFSAKKARGFMARYMAKENIKKMEDIKGFDYENYAFDESISSEYNYGFTR